jgi:hypothetical protein
METSRRSPAIVIGSLTIMLFLAAEATNGLAYLPLYVILAIDCARRGLRQIGRKKPKALPGEARSKGSR